MKRVQTDADKQEIIHLQVLKLTEEVDKLFQGYDMNVIMPVLMSSLKRCYDALLKTDHIQTWWFYVNQAFNLGWFGKPQEEEKPKLILTDNPGDKNGTPT